MGSLVAYLSMTSKKFPVSQLSSVFCLAGPLEESPQLFSGDLTSIIKKITSAYQPHIWNEVLHINFHGGPRDQLVDENLANFARFGNLSYALDIKSTELRNVFQAMDHNSLFYYKHFWDTAAPLMTQIMLASSDSPRKKMEIA